MRKYENIWIMLRDHPTQTLKLRVHNSHADTVVQAVKKEKTKDNMTRKKLGMPYFGPLKIKRTPSTNINFTDIEFKIAYDLNKLY